MSNETPIINFKSEPWKYTPKMKFDWSNFTIDSKDSLKTETIPLGLGPSEHQFEKVTLGELQEDDLITINDSFKGSDFDGADFTKRAKLDRTFKAFTSNHNLSKCVSFESALPSVAWFNLTALPAVLSFSTAFDNSFCFFEPSGSNNNTSSLLNFYVEEEANLNLNISMDNSCDSYNQINVFLKSKSNLNLFSLLAGSANYKRLEIRVFIEDPESTATLNGLSLTNESSTFEYHSDVFHISKKQELNQLYKTLNQNQGHSTFKGRVHILEQSDETSVNQLNQNILLGEKSKIDTQPELNIFHDNVKASHGATTGSISEDQIFYFESRGYTRNQAKTMLLKGFTLEPLTSVKDPNLYTFFKDRILKAVI